MRKMALIGSMLAALGLGSAASAQETISRDGLKDGLAKGTHVLVDVREPNEYTAGHVPGAVNQPLSNFNPSALPNDGRTVVVMCRSGGRSSRAQAMATAAGVRTVNYSGSILDWTGAREPVVTGSSPR